jgi:hypothetical protein
LCPLVPSNPKWCIVMLRRGGEQLGHGHAGHVAEPDDLPSLPLHPCPGHCATARHRVPYSTLAPPWSSSSTTPAGQRAPSTRPGRRSCRTHARPGHAQYTRRATTSLTPWTRSRRLEHPLATWTPPDNTSTRPWTAAAVDGEEDPANAAARHGSNASYSDAPRPSCRCQ